MNKHVLERKAKDEALIKKISSATHSASTAIEQLKGEAYRRGEFRLYYALYFIDEGLVQANQDIMKLLRSKK